jgi:hypothetical protein
MDPNTTLRELREVAQRLRITGRPDPADVDRAVELFDELDGWMCKGGFLPVQWKARR